MKSILIVDDSSTSRMFIKRCLEIAFAQKEEITYYEAENGKMALATLRKSNMDLVFLDLNMPVMDGATLIRWMKGSSKLKEIPAVVITSAGNPANTKKLIKIGAISVINKPISPEKLIPIINELFQYETDDYGY